MKAKKKPPVKVSEAQFQRMVIDLAHLYGWRVAHFRRVQVRRGSGSVYWETPVAADGKGFPDLVLVRGGSLLFAELKVPPNTTTPEQREWLAALRAAGQHVAVWTPDSWVEIEATLSEV